MITTALLTSLTAAALLTLPASAAPPSDVPNDEEAAAAPDPGAVAMSVLTARCLPCHGPRDGRGGKGGLRLDTPAGVLAGGDGGAVLVPGEPDLGELMTRVLLPQGHDDAMPPKDGRVPAQELDALRAWIAAGCPAPLPRAPAPATESARVTLLRALAQGLTAPQAEDLRAARDAGAQLTPALPATHLLHAAFVEDRARVDPQAVTPLAALRPALAAVDLSGTGVTDEALAALAGAPRLVRLDLGDTAVGDAGLGSLGPLPALRSLVLWRTRVTDEGLAALAQPGVCDALTDLYLGESAVTAAGVAAFRARRGGVRVRHATLEQLLEPPRAAADDEQGGEGRRPRDR